MCWGEQALLWSVLTLGLHRLHSPPLSPATGGVPGVAGALQSSSLLPGSVSFGENICHVELQLLFLSACLIFKGGPWKVHVLQRLRLLGHI